MTREQVIKGLYEIHAYFRDSVNAMRGGTADCTVFNGWAMTVTDALALLKEQEPRIIPFDEINDYEVLWLEVKGVETEEGLAPWVKTLNERWFSPLICSSERPDMILSQPDEYGKFCRCWTSRPTDEQRKAVKWE